MVMMRVMCTPRTRLILPVERSDSISYSQCKLFAALDREMHAIDIIVPVEALAGEDRGRLCCLHPIDGSRPRVGAQLANCLSGLLGHSRAILANGDDC